MKVALNNEPRTPAHLVFPVLMVGKDGCIKLFFDAEQGVILANKHHSNYSMRLDASPRNATPISDDYWKLYTGTITLSND